MRNQIEKYFIYEDRIENAILWRIKLRSTQFIRDQYKVLTHSKSAPLFGQVAQVVFQI